MAQNVSGGGSRDTLSQIKSKDMASLVVKDVKVIPQEFEVLVPKFVEEKQTRYVTEKEKQVKYETKIEPTVKYKEIVKDTTRYVPTKEATIKYVVEEVKIEKPVLIDKPYERPVVKDKEYTIATYGDVVALRDLMDMVPKVMDQLKTLKMEVAQIRKYKLVEEVTTVDRVKYRPVEVERIVWKDVSRERCNKCRGVVD